MRDSALWSTFSARTTCLNDVGIMTRWLRFAKHQPLTIRLLTSDIYKIADLVLDVLMEHQRQWFDIELCWEVSESPPLLAKTFALAYAAPLLQRFKLLTDMGNCGYLENDVDAELGKLLTNSPNLRTFEWSIIKTTSPETPIHLQDISFVNLRHLTLSCSMRFSCCLDILRRMPLLESCELTNTNHDHSHDADHPMAEVIHLHHLRSLCIKTRGDMSSFLDKLNLPSLQRIEIVFRVYETDELDGFVEDEAQWFSEWPHVAFLSLLQRSACPLEVLNLATSVTENQLVQYLMIVSPTLHTLRLRGKLGWACIGDYAISSMTAYPDDTEDVLCPNLRAITFHDCIISDTLNDGFMADMIQSRLILRATGGNEEPLEVILATPINFLDVTDWRRLHVLRRRSAGKLNLSLHELNEAF